MKMIKAQSNQQSEKDSLLVSETCELGLLACFFKAIEKDPRISSTHIGVYASLLNYWNEQGRAGPIRVFSHQMLAKMKISCRDTYFKYIGELSEYGYIRYERSFNRNRPSEIYLHAVTKDAELEDMKKFSVNHRRTQKH